MKTHHTHQVCTPCFKKESPSTCHLLLILLLFIARSPLAHAEAADEKVQVVGSRIARIETEGVAPVEIIESEDLVKSGSMNLEEFFRGNPLSVSGVTADRGSWNMADGGTDLNLRGSGSGRTLVLIDGQPMPKTPFGASWSMAPDPNMIPISMIERIEVLKDGASSLYGTEATAAVVNIVTKKHYNGAGASYQFYKPTGGPRGERTELSLSAGSSSEKTSLMTVLYLRKTNPFFRGDREHYKKSENAPWYTRVADFTDTNNITRASPRCGEDVGPYRTQVVTYPDGSSKCSMEPRYENEKETVRPFSEQLTSHTHFEHRLNDDTTLFGRLLLSLSDHKTQGTNPFLSFKLPYSVWSKHEAEIRAAYPDVKLPEIDQPLQFDYGPLELGGDYNTEPSRATSLSAGLKGSLGEDFNWQIIRTINSFRSRWTFHNNVSPVCVSNYTATGAFDPFLPYGQRGTLDSCKVESSLYKEYDDETVEATISGPISSLAGKDLSFSLGLSFHAYEINTYTNPQAYYSAWTKTYEQAHGKLDRQQNAVFGEFIVPVDNFEFHVSGRYDNFSDFGSTLNPKFSMSYRIGNFFLTRFSVGTSFVAPPLHLVHGEQKTNPEGRIKDDLACREDGNESYACNNEVTQVTITEGGNKDLKPETAKNFNAGFVLEPVRDLVLSADYHVTVGKGVPVSGASTYLAAEADGVDVSKFGARIVRTNNERRGRLIEIYAPVLNAGAYENTDLDLSLKYSLGREWNASFQHSQILRRVWENIEGQKSRDYVGFDGNPKWRNYTSLTYAPQNMALTFAIRGISGWKYRENYWWRQQYGDEHVANIFMGDIQFDYNFNWAGSIKLGVRNVADKWPFPVGHPGVDQWNYPSHLYGIEGREIYMGYSQEF
jgi:iron complex outermembrane receptor protein